MAIPDGKPATDFSAMNREWVRAVAEEAGDAALPSVTTSDNGDVLTVVSGKWAKAAAPASGIPAPASPTDGDVLTYDGTTSAWVAEAPSGGGGVLVCMASLIPDDPDDNEILNKTWAEINTAVSSGIPVFVISSYPDETIIANVTNVTNTEVSPYSVMGYVGVEKFTWSASSENGYPQTDYGAG